MVRIILPGIFFFFCQRIHIWNANGYLIIRGSKIADLEKAGLGSVFGSRTTVIPELSDLNMNYYMFWPEDMGVGQLWPMLKERKKMLWTARSAAKMHQSHPWDLRYMLSNLGWVGEAIVYKKTVYFEAHFISVPVPEPDPDFWIGVGSKSCA